MTKESQRSYQRADKNSEEFTMTTKRPSCEEYMRMPICEEVLEHIRSCDKCRALVDALADEVDRRAYEFEHRN